jgi:hypothetical protein
MQLLGMIALAVEKGWWSGERVVVEWSGVEKG